VLAYNPAATAGVIYIYIYIYMIYRYVYKRGAVASPVAVNREHLRFRVNPPTYR